MREHISEPILISDSHSLLIFKVMSILLLVQFTGHAAGFFSHAGVNFGLAFWSTSIATTIFITTLIVARLLILRHQIRKVLKSTGNGIYVSLSTVCIESAILYTSVALIFVVNYARNSPATELMLPYLGQVQVSYRIPWNLPFLDPLIFPLLVNYSVAHHTSIGARQSIDRPDHERHSSRD